MNHNFSCFSLIPASMDASELYHTILNAGGIPVIDIEYYRSEEWEYTIESIGSLLENKTRKNGLTIRLTASQAIKLSDSIFDEYDLIERLIICCDHGEEKDLDKALNTNKQKIIIELDNITSLEVVEKCLGRLEGIVVKGNECGGLVGEDSTFILYQKIYKATNGEVNLFVRGGIGINTAGAFRAIGASGVVLDDQLWLMPESPFKEHSKIFFRNISGQEAIPLGENVGVTCRVFSKPGLVAVDKLKTDLKLIEGKNQEPQEDAKEWEKLVRQHIGWDNHSKNVWPIGQTIGLAEILTERYKTTNRVIKAYLYDTKRNLCDAVMNNPLKENSALAKEHGTRFAIVQGPMTRVSDTADFANAVSKGGALPMLALAMMKGGQAKELLEETKSLLEDRPWGVGILGFAPKEIRDRQMEAILEIKPKFALIAGGRPDQAKDLESKGIASYLHVPSPSLLKIFVEQGARRFIFEGRECGGHVGPISSLVLWEKMIETIENEIEEKYYSEISLLFAGGIHDGRSSAFIAALTARLAKKGCKIGVLMGTAYLFTEESVDCGAILDGYQKEAIKCINTVNLETGVGHASRCAVTPFAEEFRRVRKEMLIGQYSSEEIKEELESLSLGRLRIASKGKTRNDLGIIERLSEDDVYKSGMYMIGQAATLRDSKTNIDKLHSEIAERSDSILLEEKNKLNKARDFGPNHSSEIAVIGMGTLLPGSKSPEEFWLNMQKKVDSIREIPIERWDWRIYYDSDKTAKDKIYSKWGGFIDPIEFDPLKFGIPPKSLKSIEPLQLLTLEVIQRAIDDAGYNNRDFDKENTSVILGAGGGLADLGQQYATRSEIPRFVEDPDINSWSRLPEWTEESFPGILLNVIAGRAANRFNLGGTNLTIDAACASSLAAIDVAVKELESGHSNLAIAGGVDTIQSPYAYYCFSNSQALSPRGKCYTFDKSADGICISEGLAILILKRLEDAERDGDKIYGVIKSVAGSSDGKGLGMTAPKSAGQIRAIDRAYKKAGCSPATLGVYEAHGTGTAVGDRTEMQTLTSVMKKANASPNTCSVGSAKTFIGHTKASAGVVGMVKALQSIYYKTIPPHINVENPIDEIGRKDSTMYINKDIKPWFKAKDHPRRAGVSAFGFGGTNFHAVIEEHINSENEIAGSDIWPHEIIVITGKDKNDLIQSIQNLASKIKNNDFKNISQASYWSIDRYKNKNLKCIAAITSSNKNELLKDLHNILNHIKDGKSTTLPKRIFLNIDFKPKEGKLAFIFPGQGSQYLRMMQELTSYIPELRSSIEDLDASVRIEGVDSSIGNIIYPADAYCNEEVTSQKSNISQTKIAQPSLAVVEAGLLDVLKRLGLKPDFVAGHSFGEFTALYASESIKRDDLNKISAHRGQLMQDSCSKFDGCMLAVLQDHNEVLNNIKEEKSITIANINSTKQTILSGPRDDLIRLSKKLGEKNVSCQMLNVSGAFHSEYVKDAENNLLQYIDAMEIRSPKIPVYCNSTGSKYPTDPASIRKLLGKQLTSQINFKKVIEDMYEDGARLFIEVGPKAVLSAFVKDILNKEDVVAASVNEKNDSSLAAFLNVICNLLVQGVELNLHAIFNGRRCSKLDPSNNKLKGMSEVQLSGGKCSIDTISDVTDTKNKPLVLEDLKALERKKENKGHIQPRDTKPQQDAIVVKNNSYRKTKRREAESVNQIPRGSSELLIAFQSHQETMRKFLAVQESVISQFLNPGSEIENDQYFRESINDSDAQLPTTSSTLNPTIQSNNQQEKNSRDLPRFVEESPKSVHNSYNKVDSIEVKTDLTDRTESIKTDILNLVSDRTGYPIEMLDLNQDMESDLGIDSIKRVEIIGALQKQVDAKTSKLISENMETITAFKQLSALIEFLETANSQSDGTSNFESTIHSQDVGLNHTANGSREITDEIINIISERTGYPSDMLDVNQDIEADLGIDSIKRVEILSTIQESIFKNNGAIFQEHMEELTKLKTIHSLASSVKSILSGSGDVGLGK